MADAMHTPDTPAIISRDEARALGLKFYFTGTPCKYGHVALRYTSGARCVDCERQRYLPPSTITIEDDWVCSIEGCVRQKHAKGMCSKHYYVWQRYGDPLIPYKQVRGAPGKWIEDHKNYTGTDCLIWPFGSMGKTRHNKKVKGYGRSILNGKGLGAHVHMAIVAHGDFRAAGLMVRHSCGKGHLGCCHPGHLSWGTHKDNMADMRQHKAQASGERCAKAKWTDEEILRMLSMKDEVPQKELAKIFGMSLCNVHKIIARTAWKHLG